MNFIKLVLNQDSSYSYTDASDLKMSNLGMFLAYDFDCSWSLLGKWAIDDSLGDSVSGNITRLEKEDKYILLSDLYDNEKEKPIKLKITRDEFLRLINDWQKKVCKDKPKEVIIKYVNDQFFIETTN